MAFSPDQLRRLQALLEQRRVELLNKRDDHLAGRFQPEDHYSDAMDAATRATDEAEFLGLAEQERALLGEIDHALAKFANGTYGLSELSGRDIPLERLQVLPWARRTADEEEHASRR